MPESAPVPPRKPRESCGGGDARAAAARARRRPALLWPGAVGRIAAGGAKISDRRGCASVSPLTLAGRSGLPPILLLCGGDDNIVPCEQSERFVEAAREAGNEASALIFEGAGHGGGSVNSAAGRAAIVQFLRYHGVLANGADGAAGVDALDGAVRAFRTRRRQRAAPRVRRRVVADGARARATLRLKPVAD